MAFNTPGALPPGNFVSYKDTAVPVAAPATVLPKLVVSGLPPMWRPQQVSSFFEQYGDIEDCGVVAPGRAFIRYRSAESTVRAYEKVPSMAPLQLPTGTYKLSAQLDDSDSKATAAPAAAPLLSAPSLLPQPVAPAKRAADVASFLPPAKQPRLASAPLPTTTPENNKGNFLNIIHSLSNTTPARDTGVGAPIGGAPSLVSQPAALGALSFPAAPAASPQPSSNVNLQKQLVQNLAESFLEGKLPPSLAEGLRAHLQGGGPNPLPAPVPAVAPVAPQPVPAASSADSSLQALLKLTQGKATPAVQAELQKLQQQPKLPAPAQVQPLQQPQVLRPPVAQAPPAALKTTEDSRQDVLQVLQALAASTDTSGGLKKLLVPEAPKKTATSRPEGPDAVYVVMKSKCHDFLQASVEHELWFTSEAMAEQLNKLLRHAATVILIFSVTGSGIFTGYAEMLGPVRPRREHQGISKDTLRDLPSSWHNLFRVNWLKVGSVEFPDTLNLKSDGRAVQYARDGETVSSEAGAGLCDMVDAAASAGEQAVFPEPKRDESPSPETVDFQQMTYKQYVDLMHKVPDSEPARAAK